MKPTTTSRTLKPLYVKWLVLLVAFDAVVVLFFIMPDLVEGSTLTRLTVLRALGAVVLPVVVLLLTGWLSANVKAMLVFWRLTYPLPGSRAFTTHGPTDTRINMAMLKRHVGVLPTDPAEQNAKWFSLYTTVANEPAVVEAHKSFLMYRDMAAMSLPLIVLAPLGLRVAGAQGAETWIVASFFLLQYLVTALSARHSGIRLVCNVLAIHSTRKVRAP
jgi:hypothetical protein